MELPGSAVVTGASAGIGRAVALSFADFGCRKLTLVDINYEGLRKTASLITKRIPSVQVSLQVQDVAADGVGALLVNAHINDFGRLDYLVNVAGRPGGFVKSTETSEAIFDSVQNLNVRGTYFLEQAATRQMLTQDPINGERGSIVNVGSTVSQCALPRMSPYVTSKHAVLGLTRADAIDFAADGIRVNCVLPAVINTNLGGVLPNEIKEREIDPVVQQTPMRRMGTPAEVANCVSFLCSSLASYVTGAAFTVDGGFTACGSNH